jgi:hypothetical protein
MNRMRPPGRTRRVTLVVPLLLAGGILRADNAATPAADGARTVTPFIVRNCRMCHNTVLKNAGLDFDAHLLPASLATSPEVWEKVVEKLQTRQMPPPPLPRPDQTDAVVQWIQTELESVEAARPPDPGRVTARRLNRTEYDNTVRDLLGVTLRAGDSFPHDDAGYGFDNIGDVLSVSPVLLEKYLRAAEQVSRAALLGPDPQKPSLTRLQPMGAKIEGSTAVPAEYDETGLSLPNALHVLHRFPVDAEYLFRIVPSGSRPAGSEPVKIAVFLDGQEIQVVEVDAGEGPSSSSFQQDLTGKTREFRARVAAGEHWVAASVLRLYEGLPALYEGPNPSQRPAPAPPPFRPPPNATPEKLEEARQRYETRRTQKWPVNEARVRHIELIGPYAAAAGASPESLQKVYVCGHLAGGHGPQCSRLILTDLVRRAYRRPATEADLRPLLRLAETSRKRGESFPQGIALALRAILVSPDFLFRIETPPPAGAAGAVERIGPYEMASRLSYFLWASMPDEELFRCAEDGTLHDTAVLGTQVRRMLRDPKARALVEAFGGQWLQFRALESVAPDRERFPTFENNLRFSMRRESELFLESVIREDRSILDLLDGKYAFLNERLARHYGIPGVKGQEFRRVDLSGTPRGGVLTQGSVLTVSSYSTRTSPVLRGKWVLDNLLAAPPPDPPAGVPRLDESTVGVDRSLRQQMEAHRSNVTCAACHVRMDPLGFGLENFDAIGAWRTDDGKFPIDATGALPDGRKFNGPAELEAVLREDRDAFTRAATEKLLTFALGRGLERYDRATVKAIARRVAEGEYRFSVLVMEIAQSLPFRMRKAEGGPS